MPLVLVIALQSRKFVLNELKFHLRRLCHAASVTQIAVWKWEINNSKTGSAELEKISWKFHLPTVKWLLLCEHVWHAWINRCKVYYVKEVFWEVKIFYLYLRLHEINIIVFFRPKKLPPLYRCILDYISIIN